MEPLTENLTVIGIELALVLISFAILGWVLGRLLRALGGIPGIERMDALIGALRQNLRLVVYLATFCACLAILGLNGWLWYEGFELRAETLRLLRGIPDQFWHDLAFGLAKTLGLAVALAFGLRLVRRGLDWLCAFCKALEGLRANDESLDQLFLQLKRTISRATWIYLLAIAARWLGLGDGAEQAVLAFLEIYLIIALALAAWRCVDALVDSLDGLSRKYSSANNLMRYYDRLRKLVPILRRSLEWALYVLAGVLVLDRLLPRSDWAEHWGPRLLSIIGILFLSRVGVEVARFVVDEYLLDEKKLEPQQVQRRRTIAPLLQSALEYIVYFAAGILVLKLLKLDPTPILAGAGILGLAVGFGAQNLVNDIVSGFFILFEDYYLVGDYIDAGGAEGTVERIDLRTTRIRDNDGRLHILRNGQIESVVHYSKRYTCASVNVGVAYESDLDHVYAALADVGRELNEQLPDVLEPLVVRGLDDFGESELTIRTVTKVKPGKHLAVERALRKRIKEVFDERDIEIPYARRVLIWKPEPGEEGDATPRPPVSQEA